ncbi:MAG: sulfotransferase [Planctomycetaceae bacterium]
MKLLSARELENWKAAYTNLMRKVVLRLRKESGAEVARQHTANPVLLEMFPDAKFAYIQRNPFDVFNSTLHMRKTMFRENCMGKPHLREQSDNILWLQEFLFQTYEEDKKLIPPGRLYEMKFEELEADPLGGIEQTYQALNLPNWDRLKTILEPQVPGLKEYKKNTFQYKPELMNEVYDRLKVIFDHYGYPHPSEQYEPAAA